MKLEANFLLIVTEDIDIYNDCCAKGDTAYKYYLSKTINKTSHSSILYKQLSSYFTQNVPCFFSFKEQSVNFIRE
jgi:hypothetical protein